jgi:Zn-dependent protease with chaperone function
VNVLGLSPAAFTGWFLGIFCTLALITCAVVITRQLRRESRPVVHPFEPWDAWEQRLLDTIERIAREAGIDTTEEKWWTRP